MLTHTSTPRQPFHTPLQRIRRRSAAASALLAFALAGCVQTSPTPQIGLTQAGQNPLDSAGTPTGRPAGPRSMTDSRVVVSVRPLGWVPFDGMTLPLVSPDGRHVAAQFGAAPPWGVLLADPGERQLPGVRVAAFQIPTPKPVPTSSNKQSAPAPAPEGSAQDMLAAVPWTAPLPPGLVLGRSADNAGFLVERPLPTGGRTIGFVRWSDGELTLLPESSADSQASVPPSISAFATLSPTGELAFSRARSPESGFELVLRATGFSEGPERTLSPDDIEAIGGPRVSTLLMPTFAAAADRLFLLALDRPGGTLFILSILIEGPRFRVQSFAKLASGASIATAYQAVASIQSPWPIGPRSLAARSLSPVLKSGLTLLADPLQSMVWFDGASGQLIPLAKGTVGAAPLIQGTESSPQSGLVLGTARALMYQSIPNDASAAAAFGPEVSILAGACIPRLIAELPGSPANPAALPRFVLLFPPAPVVNDDAPSRAGLARTSARTASDRVQLIELTVLQPEN